MRSLCRRLPRLNTLLATTAISLAAAATPLQADAPTPEAAAVDTSERAAEVAGAARPVTAERLLNPDAEPENWLTYHRNYAGHRYSPLDQINRDNVGDLRVAFTYSLGGVEGGGSFGHAALEGTPLVNDGFMYVTNGWGELTKLDVRDGYARPIWQMDPSTDRAWAADVTCCDIDNRGVALWQDKVVSHTLDGRLILTDDATGEIVWERQVADPAIGETITAAPLVVKDLAITGMSGAELGVRGWLAATDLNTGEEVWRRHMIPGPGEPGHETWMDDHGAWETGGAATWGNGTYDPTLNLLYWGTANPGPDFDPEYRPGDNLYTDSLVVLDADTGEMRWYFQYTPNDPHDHDEIAEHPLVDVEIEGETRQLALHAARNGFFYAFDRAEGEFIYGNQYVDQLTWTRGLDPETGVPLDYDPALQVQTYISETTGLRNQPAVSEVCPTTMGGKNWQPTAYDPNLGRIFIPVIESCGFINAAEQEKPVDQGGTWELRQYFLGMGDIRVTNIAGSIAAVDVRTGEMIEKIPMPYPMWGGMLATGGGVLFTSTVDGWVKAYDSETLEDLWSFNVGTGINAPPMTYSVDGKQYVAILVGMHQSADWRGIQEAQVGFRPTSMLYVFSL